MALELTNMVTHSATDVSFHLKNIDLPYLNGITRTIMSDLPGMAFDFIEIITNNTTINNDKVSKKIELLPVDQPLGFVIKVKNETNVKMHVTSSDMVFYSLTDPVFLQYLQTLPDKRHQNKLRQYKECGIVDNDMKDIPKNETLVPELLQEYLTSNNSLPIKKILDPVQKDVQLLILDVGNEFEVYGVAIPGIPKTQVKWQQGFAFKKQCKEIVPVLTHWDTIIQIIINDLQTIKTEEEFKKHKYSELLFYLLNTSNKPLPLENTYVNFTKLEWTSEFIQFVTKQINGIVKKTCQHVFDFKIESYEDFQRCKPCMEQIAHLLKISINDIYRLKNLPEYIVMIESNTRPSIDIWKQGIKILGKNILTLNSEIVHRVNTQLLPHTHQENGYILKLENIGHTLVGILVWEIRKEPLIANCSYTHTHPLNTYVELHMKWKKPLTNPKQHITNVLLEVIRKMFSYLQSVPLLE